MNVGVAQLDVTPEAPGLELSGFAARTQPSIGVLDPVFAKCLYLQDGDERLLWIAVDAVALGLTTLDAMRAWARQSYDLREHQVLLSATHSHSAPATVALTNCGTVDQGYLASLQIRLRECAKLALAKPQAAELVVSETSLELAIDRRGKPSAHTDPRLLALGWRDTSEKFVACALNYPMHPVTLGSDNRKISADWCGRAGGAMTRALPGAPVTLVGNGACGNLNPPVRGNDEKLIDQLGQTIANSGVAGLMRAPAAKASLKARRVVVDLPLETLSHDRIDEVSDEQLAKPAPNPRWQETFRNTMQVWRAARHREVDAGTGTTAPIELLAVRLGTFTLIAVTGEVFSRFTDDLRRQTGKPIYTIGYANGVFGYIPTDAAYDEGGYEPDVAHYFYNTFRARRGGLEMLVDRATKLINSLD